MNGNNRTNEFGEMKSRFSGEERARLADENAQIRAERKREYEKKRREAENAYDVNINSSQDKTKRNSNKNANNTKREKENSQRNNKRKVTKSSADKQKRSKEKTGYREPFKGSRNDKVRTSTLKRKKNREIHNAVIMVSLFVAAFAVISVFCIAVLKINTVVVENCDKYADSEVIEISKIKTGGSMLLISSEKAEKEIQKKLPYVKTAEISRKWPDTVVISIDETNASLAIDKGNGYILLDSSCKVLDDNADFLVTGAAPLKGAVLTNYDVGETAEFSGNISTSEISELLAALSESKIETVTSLDITSVSDITLTLDHRVEVKLGSLSNADANLLKFAQRVIEETEKTDASHEVLIDLTSGKEARVRVKNKNEVTFENESTENTEQFG